MNACRTLVAVLLLAACAHAAEHAPAFPEERTISAPERDHWAFHPLSNVAPPDVEDASWQRNPIDRFIKAALDQEQLSPLPPVGPTTLLRRVYYDLTGLPPSPQAIATFQQDHSQAAFERVVDDLLASRAYGERWAQHWLDLARFAETDGFEHDLVRPNAWRYRDWVIDALNDDLPFDRFASLQLAGDQLQPENPAAAIATGFVLCGPDMPDINLADERRHFVLNELTSTVGSVFLGLQVGCAQCHDHKFDPITQYDFYRLRAFFDSTDLFREHAIPTPDERAAYDAAQAAWTPEDRQADERRIQLERAGRQRFAEKNPDERPTLEQQLAELTTVERDELAALQQRLKQLPPLPKLAHGRVLRDGKPQSSHLYLRGDFRSPGPEIESRFPQVLLASAVRSESAIEPDSRAALARWLTSRAHPLTARVMTNRIWQWHFGRGLSATPSDFGVMGDAPTHPELLDWLAQSFIAEGWSLKRLHRQIVTSQYYRTASGPHDPGWSSEQSATAQAIWHESTDADPDNQHLWRRAPLRLEGEALRDGMLASSDSLSARHGGPGVRPPLPPEVRDTLLAGHWEVSADEEDHRRRSIYLFVRRNVTLPLFDVFDRPDTNASCAVRHQSTTATQSLVLLNSQFSLDCATRLAALLHRQAPEDPAAQIKAAYVRILCRAPSEHELSRAGMFLQSHPANVESNAPQALVDFCLALFNSNEFLYID